jgi:hypothetical protein
MVTLAVASTIASAQQADRPNSQLTQVSAAETPQPPTIVFYRPGSFYGKALKPSIYVDGKEIGRLKSGRYISYQTTAGKHLLASSKKDAELEVIVTAGQSQYVEMMIQNGAWRGAGRLVPVPVDEGKRKAEQLKAQEE